MKHFEHDFDIRLNVGTNIDVSQLDLETKFEEFITSLTDDTCEVVIEYLQDRP